METPVGTTLDHYQILSELGRGGMAVVYKAWDSTASRYVALKVLLPYLAGDHAFVERFHREAKAAAQLNHPNIVRMLEVGQQGDVHYLAMDYIEGETLHQRLEREKRLSLEAAAFIVNQIGAALDHAHAQGLVHRDVKPSNLLLKDDGQAFLSDFGIAKAVAGTKLTRTGASLGTPEYMSPEQVLGTTLDGRSDLYALGIVLYEMLTGHVPFTADTPASILYRHVYMQPPPPTVLNPRLPAHLNRVLLKALAKDPRQRYQSGHEIGLAMQASLGAPTQIVEHPARRVGLYPIAMVAGAIGVTVLAAIVVAGLTPKISPTRVAALGVVETPTLASPLPTATFLALPPTSVPEPTLAATSASTPSLMPTSTWTPVLAYPPTLTPAESPSTPIRQFHVLEPQTQLVVRISVKRQSLPDVRIDKGRPVLISEGELKTVQELKSEGEVDPGDDQRRVWLKIAILPAYYGNNEIQPTAGGNVSVFSSVDGSQSGLLRFRDSFGHFYLAPWPAENLGSNAANGNLVDLVLEGWVSEPNLRGQPGAY